MPGAGVAPARDHRCTEAVRLAGLETAVFGSEEGRPGLEQVVFGNGRPGLVESHARLLGYLKGCAVGGGFLSLVMIALLTWVLTSISELQKSLAGSKAPATTVAQKAE